MWKAPSITESIIKTIIKIRIRTLHTVQRAYIIASHFKPSRSNPKQKPKFYPTAAGANKSPFCHICHKHDGSLATANQEHLLGSCKHEDLVSLYIKRHNAALAKIQRTIYQHSPLEPFYTIMDASSRQSLPPGVSDLRLPQWVLPQVDTATLGKLRPDLLIFENLTTEEARFFDITDKTALDEKLKYIKPRVIVHVIELTYTSNYSKALDSKKQQHIKLAEYLLDAGWILSTATPNPVLHVPSPATSPTTQPPATQNDQASPPQDPSPPTAAPHTIPSPHPAAAPEQPQTRKRKAATSIQPATRQSSRLQAQNSRRLPSLSEYVTTTTPITGSKRSHPQGNSKSQRMRLDNTRSLASTSNTITSNILQQQHNIQPPNSTPKRTRSPSPNSHAQPGPSLNTTQPNKRQKSRTATSASAKTHSKRPHSPPSLDGSQTDTPSKSQKSNHDYSPHIHIVILGTDGFLFDPIETLLTTTLKIPEKSASTLLKNLHTHAINFSQIIFKRSRQLDQSLSEISLPPSHSPRPP
jgi:hypothetical protein